MSNAETPAAKCLRCGRKLTASRREARTLADTFWAAAAKVNDADTAAVLVDLTADLINHSNGHPTWLGA